MASKTLQVTLTAKDNMSATLDKAGNSAKTLGESLEQAGDAGSRSIADLSSEITQVGGVLTGFGAGITAAMGFAVNSANQLESAMANVNSIARVSKGELDGLTGQVRDLAVELALSPTDLADGLYDIVSSGFEASDAMDILEASAAAARAGLTTTATAATAVTAVLNAYGLEASEAGDVSDVLFKIVDSGVIKFEELASSMGRVLPLASTLSVGIEELGAAYAEMTLQGISASEAETGLSAIMTAAINPTTALADAVREYGYESAEALIRTEGLAGFLEFLDATAGGSASAMGDLTGNVRATNAALILSADGASGYTAALADMESAAQGGAYTQEVLALQMDTTAASIDRMQAVIGNLALTMGGTLQPAVRTTADAMTGLAAGVNELPGPVQSVATVLTAAAGGVSLLGGAALLAAPRILATKTALQSLGGVRGTIGLLARSFGPVGLAITGVTVVAGLLISKYGETARAAEELAAVNDALNDTFVDLRLNGIDTSEMEEYARALNEIRDIPQPDAFHIFENTDASAQELALLNDIVDAQHDVSSAEFTAGMDTYIRAITDARISTQEFFAWYDAAVAKMMVSTTDEFGPDWFFKELADLDLSEFRREADGAADAIDDTTAAIDGTSSSASVLNTVLGQFSDDWTETLAAEEAERTTAALDLLVETMERLQQAQIDFIASGMALAGWDDALSQIDLSTLRTDATGLAEDISVAGSALENTFRIIVGNTNALGGQISAVNDWAIELIGVQGEYAKIDDLLASGAISLETYNAAQQAQVDIGIANAAVQEDLLSIQAQQAPLIADLTAQQAAYISTLAGLPEQQQLIALGWMDSATAAQAMEAQSLIAAAAMGEMGDAGRDATQGFIEGAIAANPVLEELLTDLELVSRDHEGNLIIDFAGAEGARSEIDLLNESIRTLADVMDDGAINGSIGVQVTGQEDTNALVAALLNIDGTTANASVAADTGTANSDLDTTAGLLTNIDGKTATATVTVQSGNATVGDGTGGAQNWRDFLDIPEDVSTTVTATTSGGADVEALASTVADLPPSASIAVSVDAQGFAEIGSLFEMVRALDETSATIAVDADTSAVDAALNQFGVFDNPTGGAAVMSPAGSVMVAFLADTSDIDDWEPPEFENVMISVISSTHGAQIALDNITSAADNLAASQIMVTVEADTGTAVTALNDVINAANNLAISQITVNVSAETGTAVTGLNSVTVAANAIPPSESVTVVALAEGATFALNGVTAAANAIPESESVTVTVFGADGAVSALNSVTNAANSIPSSRSTTITTNRVTNNVQTYSTRNMRGDAYAHGGMVGVPSFAGGGMVPFWAGENGPELAHFAHGGSALLPNEGMYAAPPMTYISPNNAVSNEYGGSEVNINIYGNVYGIDDLTAQVTDRLATAIAPAMREYERGMGVA